jgi:hypothetical protein
MSPVTRIVLGSIAVVAVFAVGRLSAPATEIVSPGAHGRAPHGNAVADSEEHLEEHGGAFNAMHVGDADASAPLLAMVTVTFGPRANTSTYYASGFLIRNDVVATSAHVLPEQFSAEGDHIFVDCDGKRIAGTIVYLDRALEVLLIGASCGQTDVDVDTTPLDWDEPLVFAGYDFTFENDDERKRLERATPFTRPTSFIPGVNLGDDEERFEESARRVYREIRRRHLPEPLAIAGAMQRGNSGGPVYRRKNGDIVGMAIILDAAFNRTFIVPAVTIHMALQRAKLLNE